MRHILLGLACLTFVCFVPSTGSAHEPGGRLSVAAGLSEPVRIDCASADCAIDTPAAVGATRARFSPPRWISGAISQASAASGVDFDYMLRAAALESTFDPFKEVSTSSAKGLYQFIEHTWFYMVHEVGGQFGLQEFADAIGTDKEGRFVVGDAGMRSVILWLRNDPWLSAAFAAEFTRRNADWLARALGRAADPAELYLAHVLGAAGAAELIGLAEAKPGADACKQFARAARANRTIFYNGKKPRTAQEVYDVLVNKYFDIPVDALEAAPWRAVPAAGGLPLPVHYLGEHELIHAMR